MSSKQVFSIHSYADAAAVLATARRPADGKPIHKNCRIVEGSTAGSIAIRYYDTDVVTFYPDGTFRLDNGGHLTLSTRDWMEAVAPVFIRQKAHKWEILIDGKATWQPYVNGLTYRSLDGTRSTLTYAQDDDSGVKNFLAIHGKKPAAKRARKKAAAV